MRFAYVLMCVSLLTLVMIAMAATVEVPRASVHNPGVARIELGTGSCVIGPFYLLNDSSERVRTPSYSWPECMK